MNHISFVIILGLLIIFVLSFVIIFVIILGLIIICEPYIFYIWSFTCQSTQRTVLYGQLAYKQALGASGITDNLYEISSFTVAPTKQAFCFFTALSSQQLYHISESTTTFSQQTAEPNTPISCLASSKRGSGSNCSYCER